MQQPLAALQTTSLRQREMDRSTRAHGTRGAPLKPPSSWFVPIYRHQPKVGLVRRIFSNDTCLSYDERLKQLNIYSLEHRMLYFDLLWCYKLLFGLARVDRDDFFTLRSCSTRGHPYKIFKYFCNNSVRSNFFAERVINLWIAY